MCLTLLEVECNKIVDENLQFVNGWEQYACYVNSNVALAKHSSCVRVKINIKLKIKKKEKENQDEPKVSFR